MNRTSSSSPPVVFVVDDDPAVCSSLKFALELEGFAVSTYGDGEALLSQAALETGWGRAMIRRADGSPSFNVFGIKADSRWSGDTATTATLEYSDGVAQRKQQTFRAYSSYGEAFDDYARFLQSNPRYGDALQRTSDVKSFVHALAQAGYATDPAYAGKIQNILDGRPLREALAGLKSAGDPPLTT